MMPPPTKSRLIRFQTFEVDLKAGEIRRDGQCIRLQEQPLQVLTMLVENAGDIVTRDELRERLWPDNTFVDFDQGLNKAINKIRRALGDLAEDPSYVETLPKRGYRLIVPVKRVNQGPQFSNGRGKAKPRAPSGNGTGRTVQASPLGLRRALGVGATAALKAFLSILGSRKPLPNKANG